MRSKRILGLLAVSTVLGLVWLVGLAWTMLDYFGITSAAAPPVSPPSAAPASPSAPIVKEEGTLRILALGDSLTRGYGDPEGKGYAGVARELLEEQSGLEVVLANRGVNGQTAVLLTALLQQDEEVRAEAAAADMVFVSIGGNDLFRGGQTLARLDLEEVAQIADGFEQELPTIISSVRELNPEAVIVLIGLYNPFIEQNDAETTSRIVRDWNYRMSHIAADYPKTVVVPTFDLFQLQSVQRLHTDQFHPNGDGYRLIAERVASLINWGEAAE